MEDILVRLAPWNLGLQLAALVAWAAHLVPLARVLAVQAQIGEPGTDEMELAKQMARELSGRAGMLALLASWYFAAILLLTPNAGPDGVGLAVKLGSLMGLSLLHLWLYRVRRAMQVDRPGPAPARLRRVGLLGLGGFGLVAALAASGGG